jgi:molybdenum cofactor guanylyltransferase
MSRSSQALTATAGIYRDMPGMNRQTAVMVSDFQHRSYRRESVTGLVLAGGRATRMGGPDKGLIELAGRPMIEHVLAALRPQVGSVLINANRNLEQYAALGCEVIPDGMSGYPGPLAGVQSGLRALRSPYLLTVPCDSPLLAADLTERLFTACRDQRAEIAVAHDGERLHPVFMLLKKELRQSLDEYLARDGRKIDSWLIQHRVATADFSDRRDSFVNVNDPDERRRVEMLMRSLASPH